MKTILSKLCIWILRKLKISVMLHVEINRDKKYCKPKYDLNEVWYTDLEGIAFIDWNRCGYCTVKNLTPAKGQNSISAIITGKI